MKKIFSVAALAVSAVLGVLYLLSLLWWTDPSTGFVTWGGTQTRYFAMLFPVLLAFCVGRATSAKVRFRNAWRSTKVLLPVSMASAVYGFMTIFSVLFGAQTPSRSHHLTATLALLGDLAELLLAVLFLLFSLWGILIFLGGHQGQTSASLYLGLAGSTAFFLHTVLCFLMQPASLYRIPPVVEILAALAALVFVSTYLKVYYLPEQQGSVRGVCRNGLLAFFFCTCLETPQAIWQFANGEGSLLNLLLGIVLGLVGLWGAMVSSKVSWNC
ncbi:hypothetical protein [uncultured Ruthenibacterium sp.]|uniref:hypothetical protein n=1 Tax=uncultured Ruthenibacterium sp. TaxID=1905347 RepID=UPI00349E603A